MRQARLPIRVRPPAIAGPQTETEPSTDTGSPAGNGRERAVPALRAPGVVTSTATTSFTVETALYIVILAAAISSRFWDLGSRTLHHDESLHAYFSWLLATGQGYTHDPLMHGPFLFHFNALTYFLLGATDASSRFSAALFGVALVALPLLLRGERHLGRWGALTASALFLISPALLYQSRYIRHDIFTVVGSLFLFVAIVRYIERPSRPWLIAIGATLGFLLTNHEIVFGIAAIFFAVIAGALFWGRLRPLTPVLVIVGVAAIALILKLPQVTGRPLPTIPWSSPSRTEQFTFYRQLLTNPLTIALVALALITVVVSVLIARRLRVPDRIAEDWPLALFGDAPRGSITAAVREAWRDSAGVSWALVAGIVIFATLFTTLFTNLYGLATGTIATDGTLLYWLGQHDYRRGEQPWFYYLLLFPQYEFIAVVFGTVATAVIGVHAVLVGLGRRIPGHRFVFQLFLAIWFCGIFLALSWAGEKMPWLVIHITLPATLLAAVLLGEAWERFQPALSAQRVTPSAHWGWPEWGVLGGLLGLAACWFLSAASMTFGEFVTSSNAGGRARALTPWALEHWWLLALPFAAALLTLVIAAWRRGPARSGQPALVALVLILALAQVHAAWRLVYQEGDVPKDMLVYTQTAPDVQRMIGELTTLSESLTGGRDLEIWYDDGISWPMQWYLRDFPNRHLYGSTLAGPGSGAPVVLVTGDNRFSVEPEMQGYTPQRYVLRWWFPEDPIYRNFAIAPELNPGRSAWKSTDQPHGIRAIAGSIFESLSHLLTPAGQQQLYRLVMYRDLPVRIDSYDYTLYIRNDLVPLFNQIRY